MGKKINAGYLIVTSLTVALCGGILGSRSSYGAPGDAATLSSQVNDTLGLRASKVASLEVRASAADKLSVNIPLDQEAATLDLKLESVRSPDYHLQVDFGGGNLGEVP